MVRYRIYGIWLKLADPSSGHLHHCARARLSMCFGRAVSKTYVMNHSNGLPQLIHCAGGMRNVTCVHAKSVPIVKIWDAEFEIACDLNVNNLVALRNTEMVKAYMELDSRVRPLAMIVKYWTNRRVINEGQQHSLLMLVSGLISSSVGRHS